MSRCAPVILLALGLALAGLTSVAPATASAPSADDDAISITRISRAFSPDGDGDHDVATVRYELAKPGTVSVKVTDFRNDKVVYAADLGRHRVGAHRWNWNGQTTRGARLRQQFYAVTLRVAGSSDRAWTEIDRRFSSWPSLAKTYGQPRSTTQAVYPRTRVVRDALGILGHTEEIGVRRATLLVRSTKGKVVARRNLVRRPTFKRVDGYSREFPMMWSGRDGKGRPLPAGRYEALIRGVDRVGNAGTSKPVPLRVSRDRLEWVKETRTVSPHAAAVEACGWSGANGACDSMLWECGTVIDSTRFAGGTSHRSGVCDDPVLQTNPVAEKDYYVTVPAAVRGLEVMRVSFTGSPTVPGESDPGRLVYYDSGSDIEVVSSTGGRTPWITSWMGMGQAAWGGREPRVPVSAVWKFRTTGTDSFDIERFTLDLRYLARVTE